MRKAIDKILNNFVFLDKDIINYTIEKYPTPEMNVVKYEINIWTDINISSKDVDILRERLETAFSMLGFRPSYVNFFNDRMRGEFLIKGIANIELSR